MRSCQLGSGCSNHVSTQALIAWQSSYRVDLIWNKLLAFAYFSIESVIRLFFRVRRGLKSAFLTDPKMRPRLQLGNPADQWLSPSVWANSQSATNVQLPWRPVDGNDANYLRSEEDLYDDRGRDRVSTSFTHEDAVKDVRLHEVVMQYLRDRSA